MRIAIEFTAALEEGAGIGRLTRELVSALIRQRPEHAFTLLGPKGADWAQAPASLLPNVRRATLPVSSRAMSVLWYRFRLPLAVDRWTGPADLFHATDYTMPPHRMPAVVTVHDLSFLRHPELAHPKLARFLTTAVPHAVADACLVVADSEHTRRDVIELLGAPAEKVRVAYGGVGPAFTPASPEAVASTAERHGLTAGNYLLSVSRLEPRKNLVGLLHAYRALVDRRGESTPPLAIGGSAGWMFQPIYDALETLKLGSRVRLLGRVPDADLPSLLTGASCFVYPSFYEGFGLPPLEALACGAPVVASNASCLPEALGEAALYAAPADTEGIARAIERVLDDGALRATLRERGFAQARRFTWDAAATQLMAAYESAGVVH